MSQRLPIIAADSATFVCRNTSIEMSESISVRTYLRVCAPNASCISRALAKSNHMNKGATAAESANCKCSIQFDYDGGVEWGPYCQRGLQVGCWRGLRGNCTWWSALPWHLSGFRAASQVSENCINAWHFSTIALATLLTLPHAITAASPSCPIPCSWLVVCFQYSKQLVPYANVWQMPNFGGSSYGPKNEERCTKRNWRAMPTKCECM